MNDSIQTARLGRKWLIKMVIVILVLVGFAVWGLYDATVAYPRRGRQDADYKKLQYLTQAQAENALDGGVSVEEPQDTLTRLQNRDAGSRNALDQAKLTWLESLETVGELTPENTRIPDARAELDRLIQEWQNKNAPKALAAWDIPSQWGIMAAAAIGAVWLLVLFINVVRQKYRWNAASQRLTLPDGSSLVPGDIAEFDKRKWHKFIVFLHIKPGHEKHGGRQVKLDLYRYDPLEAWVLEMEKTAFPESVEQKPEEPSTEAAAAS